MIFGDHDGEIDTLIEPRTRSQEPGARSQEPGAMRFGYGEDRGGKCETVATRQA